MKRVWQNHAMRVALLTALFAVVATFLVTLTESGTREGILENQRQATLNAISDLLPQDRYNNEILQDVILLPPNEQLGTTEITKVYRARQSDVPVAAVFTAVAPDGYSGTITLLVGVYTDNSLAGVRVINHRETPGLGDKIEAQRDDWILEFSNLSLNDPAPSQWKVKKDGGVFDQFTGATITPRAVVAAIKRALEFFAANQDKLFTKAEMTP